MAGPLQRPLMEPADRAFEIETLLGAGEPAPVDHREGDGDPFVFVCEHASNRLPRALGDLGLPRSAFDRHIAFDPGAAKLTLGLAARFQAEAVLQRYSRLAIDCNRSPERPDAITELSETTVIPGNQGLGDGDRRRRIEAIWSPFHAALDEVIGRRIASGRPTVLVTIHSFNPVYRGIARPWHVGIISAGERSFADEMLRALRRDTALCIGDEQPYSMRDHVDYTIRRHGQDRGLPHVMIEMRNDLLRTSPDIAGWTRRLAEALAQCAEERGFKVQGGT